MQKTAITRGVKELLKGELPEVTLRAIRKIEEAHRPSQRMLEGYRKGTERMLSRTKTRVEHGAPFSGYDPIANRVYLKNFTEIYPATGWSGSKVRNVAKNLTPEQREWVQELVKRHEAYEASSFASARRRETKLRIREQAKRPGYIPFPIHAFDPLTAAEKAVWRPVVSKKSFTHGLPFGQHFGPEVLLRESRDVTRVGGPAAEVFRGARKATHEAEVLRRAGVEYGTKNPLRYGKAARRLRGEQLHTTDELPIWTSRYGGVRITPSHAAAAMVGLGVLPAAVMGGHALLKKRRQRKEASLADVAFAGFLGAMRKWAATTTTEKAISAVPGAGVGAYGGFRLGKQLGSGRFGKLVSILGGSLLGGTGTAVGYTKYRKLRSRFEPSPWEKLKQAEASAPLPNRKVFYIISHDGSPVEVHLEVAGTDEEKQRGLMFRDMLGEEFENEGMIFPFDKPSVRSFWMRNVKIPLDMLFVRDGKVVKIVDSAEPGSDEPHSSDIPVTDVIELAGGFCRRHGIGPGALVQDG